MWLAITRAQWLGGQELHVLLPEWQLSEEEVIRCNADWLIARCYAPHEEAGCRVTAESLAQLGLSGLESEAINWGDLRVVEVRAFGSAWEVLIEEASPDCPALAAYITGWLNKWGWPDVLVRTEW